MGAHPDVLRESRRERRTRGTLAPYGSPSYAARSRGWKKTFKPQPFSLIVTISDPEKKARVYDEMAQIVRNRFQSQSLTVRTAARIRTKQ